MSQPRKVANTFDWHAIWSGSIAEGASQQIAFVPVGYKADGPPAGAADGAVPCLIGHEILITNPASSSSDLHIAVAAANSPGVGQWLPFQSTMKPGYVDPTTFPVPDDTNTIIVPIGAIAFPIRVRAFGITISSPNGDSAPSLVAYGPLSLES